ncbi:mitochondrial hydroxyacylglutathione hydrolase [Basidiobolus meristosporus CBS 931.73]|uniref:hydroxyacylglutathione hydrolase n=1 Tax=Basidiobolus meristosporus CBS 931.73 TaxID=1314790 RepID=A0A1Y1YVH7_9FUNG|nr:mitochondrial hydroxyacylglutathione hydrolase [Basidiobolus meristosporus CBS 931.73]|eukprot:ORY01956.1 mitochondrial hydroxyacylglutathione hydrolase [Basidiobolus meristosporus CBS 931.73]
MKVLTIPALEDNYSYLIIDEKANEAIAVDPVEPKKILKAATEAQVKLTSVFTTHHHWDHAGGNEELLSLRPNLAVYGADPRIAKLTNFVKDNDTFKIGSLSIKGLMTICHTNGSMSYFVTDDADKAVFTGDTLFIGGCGRFFEGTPEDMHHSLSSVLASLPKETRVYCGHEYTKSNLKFALSVDPDNTRLQEKLIWCESNSISVPSTIGEELQYNPFMRVTDPVIQKNIGETNPIDTMAKLREMKNNF